MLNVKKAYKEMWEFQQILLNDIQAARDFAKKEPTQFALRTIYRTSAAYIEGVVYQLRLVCLAALEDTPSIYNPNEIIALREKSVNLTAQGKLEERDSFQKLKPSILFLFSCFSKLHNIEFSPNTSDNRWQSFGKFIELRNLLMHPKSRSDFEISEHANKISIEAITWFHDNLKDLYRQCEATDATSAT